jgi:hypothetical protein
MPSAGVPLEEPDVLFRRSLDLETQPCVQAHGVNACINNNQEGMKMKWGDILRLSAIAALGLALLPSNAVSQQKSLKDQLVGTWTVVSWEQTRNDGSKFERFGANPKGVNIFDANGRFFVMFARPDLPKIASSNPSTPTPEEAKAIVGGTIGYFGTYTVDEANKTITLHIEASSFPNQLGSDQKRTISVLTADELKYSNPVAMSGGKIDVAMKRAK